VRIGPLNRAALFISRERPPEGNLMAERGSDAPCNKYCFSYALAYAHVYRYEEALLRRL